MEDLDVCAGESPRFAVVVEGKPVPDILWFKVGVFSYSLSHKYSVFLLKSVLVAFQSDILLAESSHYTFVYDDNECSLVVLNACPEDSGVYTCTARNLAGSVSCKAELTVHESKIFFFSLSILRLFAFFHCKHVHLMQPRAKKIP